MNFAKFLKTPFLTDQLRWLFLSKTEQTPIESSNVVQDIFWASYVHSICRVIAFKPIMSIRCPRIYHFWLWSFGKGFFVPTYTKQRNDYMFLNLIELYFGCWQKRYILKFFCKTAVLKNYTNYIVSLWCYPCFFF